MTKSFFDLPVHEDTMQEALDKHNITKLLEYERYCRDNLRFDEQEACYARTSRVRITWYDGDGREFVERSRKMAEGDGRKNQTGTYAMPHHKIYNTFVWLNSNKAVAEMQCMMGAYHVINEVEYHRFGWARLLYRVVKEDDVWKIAGMDCIYERDMLIPVVPDAKAAVNPKEFEQYRPSYKCCSWMFDKMGMPCNQELPGDDRPETVQKLYDEASEWLFA